MNFFDVNGFISDFGASTIIIGVIVYLLDYFTDKFLSNKIPLVIKNALPLFFGLLLTFCYEVIFITKKFAFTENVFYAGILTYSLSTVIKVFITKLKRGDNITLDVLVLLVEGIIDGYVNDGQKTAVAHTVASILREANVIESEKRRMVKEHITNTAVEDIDEAKVSLLVESIFVQTKNVKNKTEK